MEYLFPVKPILGKISIIVSQSNYRIFWSAICPDLIYAETYLEPYQICKIELFAKIVNSWKPLTIFASNSILDVWQGSQYTCFIDHYKWFKHAESKERTNWKSHVLMGVVMPRFMQNPWGAHRPSDRFIPVENNQEWKIVGVSSKVDGFAGDKHQN